jgi:hypothetical protein
MLPDIEGQNRLKAAGDGIAGVGLLGDDEGAAGGGGEPDPAGAEEADAFGDEVGFEGVDATPLFLICSARGPSVSGAPPGQNCVKYRLWFRI